MFAWQSLAKIPLTRLAPILASPSQTFARGMAVKTLLISNLPLYAEQEDIEEHFGQYARLLDVRMPYKSGRTRRMCFIDVNDEGAKAIKSKMAEHVLLGKRVSIKEDSSSDDGRGSRKR